MLAGLIMSGHSLYNSVLQSKLQRIMDGKDLSSLDEEKITLLREWIASGTTVELQKAKLLLNSLADKKEDSNSTTSINSDNTDKDNSTNQSISLSKDDSVDEEPANTNIPTKLNNSDTVTPLVSDEDIEVTDNQPNSPIVDRDEEIGLLKEIRDELKKPTRVAIPALENISNPSLIGGSNSSDFPLLARTQAEQPQAVQDIPTNNIINAEIVGEAKREDRNESTNVNNTVSAITDNAFLLPAPIKQDEDATIDVDKGSSKFNLPAEIRDMSKSLVSQIMKSQQTDTMYSKQIVHNLTKLNQGQEEAKIDELRRAEEEDNRWDRMFEDMENRPTSGGSNSGGLLDGLLGGGKKGGMLPKVGGMLRGAGGLAVRGAGALASGVGSIASSVGSLAMANPITAGILAAGAVAYGGYKLYDHFRGSEESKAIFDRLVDDGVIDHDIIGDSEIENWEAIEGLKKEDLKNLIEYDDFSEDDKKKMEEILAEKEGKKGGNKPKKDKIKTPTSVERTGKDYSKESAVKKNSILDNLHKATPLGFVYDKLRGSEKSKAVFDKLVDDGVIDHDWIGSSEILDWEAIKTLKEENLKDLIEYDDFNDEDKEALEKILKEKAVSKADNSSIVSDLINKQPTDNPISKSPQPYQTVTFDKDKKVNFTKEEFDTYVKYSKDDLGKADEYATSLYNKQQSNSAIPSKVTTNEYSMSDGKGAKVNITAEQSKRLDAIQDKLEAKFNSGETDSPEYQALLEEQEQIRSTISKEVNNTKKTIPTVNNLEKVSNPKLDVPKVSNSQGKRLDKGSGPSIISKDENQAKGESSKGSTNSIISSNPVNTTIINTSNEFLGSSKVATKWSL